MKVVGDYEKRHVGGAALARMSERDRVVALLRRAQDDFEDAGYYSLADLQRLARVALQVADRELREIAGAVFETDHDEVLELAL